MDVRIVSSLFALLIVNLDGKMCVGPVRASPNRSNTGLIRFGSTGISLCEAYSRCRVE